MKPFVLTSRFGASTSFVHWRLKICRNFEIWAVVFGRLIGVLYFFCGGRCSDGLLVEGGNGSDPPKKNKKKEEKKGNFAEISVV